MLLRVGIATRDWAAHSDETPTLGGSGHYRCGLVARVLRDLGHDVVLGTLCASPNELGVVTWDLEKHWGFDVVLLQRWMFDDLPVRILRARANGQVVLNDVDDWWEGLDPSNLAFKTSHPGANPGENRDHYRRVLSASTAVVCSTPFLESRYARLAPTLLVRNVLDLARWTPQEPREGPPTLGWVGALPWRSKGDVEALAGFLGSFLVKHGLRFRHAGAMTEAKDFAAAARIPPDLLDQTPLVPIAGHERQFEGIDVAVVPLADKPFNQAKSCLKGMQAAAAGVPYVATAMPEYRWLRDSRGVGRTTKNPREWIRHLEWLIDPEQRAKDSAYNAASISGMGLPVLAAHWEYVLSAVR